MPTIYSATENPDSGHYHRCKFTYTSVETGTNVTVTCTNTLQVKLTSAYYASSAVYTSSKVYFWLLEGTNSSGSGLQTCYNQNFTSTSKVTVKRDNTWYDVATKSVTFTVDKYSDSNLYIYVWANGGTYYGNSTTFTVPNAGDPNTPLITASRITSYPVLYYSNDGSGQSFSNTKTYGTDLAIAQNSFVRPQYVFTSWNTEPDGSGTSYSAGDTYSNNAALTLYAIWQDGVVIESVSRVNSGGVADDAGGYCKVVCSYDSSLIVTGYSLTVGSLSTSSGTHDTANHTITIVAGDGTNILPLTTYDVRVDIETTVGNGYDVSSLASSTTYAKPTISPNALTRVWNNGTAYVEDALGTKLLSEVSYAIQQTPTQLKPTSIVYSFAGIGPSSGSVDVSSLSSSGSVDIYSDSFVYEDLSPSAALSNEFVVTVSDKFYSATATVNLNSTSYQTPTISEVTAERSDSSGSVEDDGESLLVTTGWQWYSSSYNNTGLTILIKGYDKNNQLVAQKAVPYVPETGTDGLVLASIETILTDSDGIGSGFEGFSADSTFTITVTISDLVGSSSKSDVVTTAFFTMDVLAGGHGVSFGAPSETPCFNVSMPRKFWKQPEYPLIAYSTLASAQSNVTEDMTPCMVLCEDDASLWVVTTSQSSALIFTQAGKVQRGDFSVLGNASVGETLNAEKVNIVKSDSDTDNNAISISNGTLVISYDGGVITSGEFVTKDTRYDAAASSISGDPYRVWGVLDKNNKYVSYIQTHENPNGMDSISLGARKIVNGSNVDNTISLNVAANGTRSIGLSDPAPWRDALGIGDSTTHDGEMTSVKNKTYTVIESFTVQKGIWLVLLAMYVEGNGSGSYRSFTISTASSISGQSFPGTFGFRPTSFSRYTEAAHYLSVNAATTHRIFAYQDSGGNLNMRSKVRLIRLQ